MERAKIAVNPDDAQKCKSGLRLLLCKTSELYCLPENGPDKLKARREKGLGNGEVKGEIGTPWTRLKFRPSVS